VKKILEKVFKHQSLADRPPVLVDIGASTGLPPQWRNIAGYSICIAFDPDRRQMEYIAEERGFKKMYIFPAIVHENIDGATDFYLTASPECSSALPPQDDALNEYLFSPLFKLKERVTLPSITLTAALEKLGIDYIDWFKTDSQGTDLRIFKSIPQNIRDRIITAEFEPGIIDAYKGEDKLSMLMAFMEKESFWCSRFDLRECLRITPDIAGKYFSGWQRKLLNTALSLSPGWAEIAFMNKFSNTKMGIREYLLGWWFATEMKQYGEALKIAETGLMLYNDEIFRELISFSVKTVKHKCIFNIRIPLKFLRRLCRFNAG